MDIKPNNVILTTYISFPVQRIEEVMRVLTENDLYPDLTTTKQFYDAMMFKYKAPRA